MKIDIKTIGALLVGFSLILLLVLTFVKIGVDKEAAVLCKVFSDNQLDMSQCPAHESNTSWLILSAFGVGFVMLGAGIYLIFSPRRSAEEQEPKPEFKQIDLSKLDEEEKKAYEIIKAKGGSAYQTDLIKETSFSKVKVTRVLDRLETKGVLERKRRGMTNLVVLR